LKISIYVENDETELKEKIELFPSYLVKEMEF